MRNPNFDEIVEMAKYFKVTVTKNKRGNYMLYKDDKPVAEIFKFDSLWPAICRIGKVGAI